MSFKVLGTLTNVRSPKTENPELSTTPTKGNIKLNNPASNKIKVNKGDYIAIAPVDTGGEAPELYIFKGNASDKEKNINQIGAILAGKSGGALQFSSENAFRQLGGNKDNKKVYSIGEGQEHDGVTYYKLDFLRDETKLEKGKKS